MKKIKNDSQPYRVYIFAILCLPFAAFFIGLCFYAILSSFDKINFGSMYGILLSIIFLYLIIRAIKNGIFIFKELRIPLLDIENIIDKGCKIPRVSTRSLVLTIFFKPYERILIKMKSGKEYQIFVDADPYSFRNYDNNKFIRTYNELKEMVIEEQNRLYFNQKNWKFNWEI